MLTAAQCQTVAYLVDGGTFYCPHCVRPAELNAEGTSEIIEYTANEQEDGVFCERCGREISEPHPHYLTVSLNLETSRGNDADIVSDELTSWLDSLSYVQRYSRLTVVNE